MEEIITGHLMPLLNALIIADNKRFRGEKTLFTAKAKRCVAFKAARLLILALDKLDDDSAKATADAFNRLYND